MKLTKKGYLFLSIFILVLLVSVSVYAYVASQRVRDFVGKLISKQPTSTTTSSPTPGLTPVPNASPSPNATLSPTPNVQASSDIEIKSNILQGILKNPEWRKNEIEIKVVNGSVDIRGAVSDKAQLPQIEQFIRSLTGVKQVSMFLEVKAESATDLSPLPSPSPSTTSTENPNETLAKEVEFACYKTDAFEIKNIKFSAKDGQIVLSGKVRNKAERLLAERVTKEVAGVKSVINELEVKLN